MAHSAAGNNDGSVIGITDMDRQTGLYEDRFTGIDRERLIEEGAKIEAGGARCCIARKVLADAVVKNRECNFNFLLLVVRLFSFYKPFVPLKLLMLRERANKTSECYRHSHGNPA